MPIINCKQLDEEICRFYEFDNFNSAFALFGAEGLNGGEHYILVTDEEIQKIKDYQTQCFDKYVADCLLIFTYLRNQGYEGRIKVIL